MNKKGTQVFYFLHTFFYLPNYNQAKMNCDFLGVIGN